MAKEYWKSGSGIGNVMVFVFSKRYSITQDVYKRISKEFHNIRVCYTSKTCSLYYLDCQYTIEDKLYPILRSMREDESFSENKTYIACFAFFKDDLYTEQFILKPSMDKFSVGTLTETTLEAVKAEEDAFDKAVDLYLKKYPLEKISVDKLKDKVQVEINSRVNIAAPPMIRGEDSPLFAAIKELFKITLARTTTDDEKQSRRDVIDKAFKEEYPFVYMSASQLGHTYYFDGKEKVYVIDAFTMKYAIPYYMPFVSLFFASKNAIKDLMTDGNFGMYLYENDMIDILPNPSMFLWKEDGDFNIFRDHAYSVLVKELSDMVEGKING